MQTAKLDRKSCFAQQDTERGQLPRFEALHILEQVCKLRIKNVDRVDKLIVVPSEILSEVCNPIFKWNEVFTENHRLPFLDCLVENSKQLSKHCTVFFETALQPKQSLGSP